MSRTPDPKTLTEAVNLGKGYGIDTAETILALAISKTIEKLPVPLTATLILNSLRGEFKKECEAYKSQLTKPVTEEEKKQILEP